MSDIVVVEAFKHAKAADPNALLVYGDYSCIFASKPGDFNQNIESNVAFIRLLEASGAPVDGVCIQLFQPVWACLTIEEKPGEGEGEGEGEGDTMRLNPRQLSGIVESLTAFAHCVPGKSLPVATQIDVRMGITEQSTPFDNDEHLQMIMNVDTLWENASFEVRQQWQREVYKAIFNAMLSVPELYSVTLWGIQDGKSWLNWLESSDWPWTPPLFDNEGHDCDNPNPAASNPCLLGAKWVPCGGEGEGEGECGEMVGLFYPKPAYDGMREAIENYFGIAHVVRDQDGEELVRFVRNGNVIVLKGEIEEEYTNWTSTLEDKAFILLNSACNQQVAEITQDGDLHLANGVAEDQSNLEAPTEGNALVIKNAQGEVVSMIDENGNLKAKGEVIVHGVPYTLNKKYGDGSENEDPYSIYP